MLLGYLNIELLKGGGVLEAVIRELFTGKRKEKWSSLQHKTFT
jgi:hypothetical protein